MFIIDDAAIGFGVLVVIGVGALVSGCSDDGGEDTSSASAAEVNFSGDSKCNNRCHTTPQNLPVSGFQMYGEETKDAHRFHLKPRYTNPIFCSNCHPVPDTVWNSLPHLNKEKNVTADGFFDPLTKSCNDLSCHGGHEMNWKVGYKKPTLECNSCHKETNPKHDITDTKQCYSCHDQTVDESGNIRSKEFHLNGVVDKVAKVCVVCHDEPPKTHTADVDPAATVLGDKTIAGLLGDCGNCHPTKPASPFKNDESAHHRNGIFGDLQDDPCNSCHEKEPTSGAHQSHLHPQLAGTVTQEVSCEICHDVPVKGVELWEHMDPIKWAIVAFKGIAKGAQYDAVARSCSDVYCHGSALPEGQKVKLNWYDSSGEPKQCGACHGVPPSSQLTVHSADDITCADCHDTSKHVDGEIDLK